MFSMKIFGNLLLIAAFCAPIVYCYMEKISLLDGPGVICLLALIGLFLLNRKKA